MASELPSALAPASISGAAPVQSSPQLPKISRLFVRFQAGVVMRVAGADTSDKDKWKDEGEA